MWLTVHQRSGGKAITLWFGPGGVIAIHLGENGQGATLVAADGHTEKVLEDQADIADALDARTVYVSAPTPKAVA